MDFSWEQNIGPQSGIKRAANLGWQRGGEGLGSGERVGTGRGHQNVAERAGRQHAHPVAVRRRSGRGSAEDRANLAIDIIRHRRRLGLTQVELARRAGKFCVVVPIHTRGGCQNFGRL